MKRSIGLTFLAIVCTCTVAHAASTYWVYHDGRFRWPGDWSWAANAVYTDTSGAPLSGKHDIAVTLTSPWGGWLPYAPGRRFDLSPYGYLTLAIKATEPSQSFHVFFEAANDTSIGRGVDPAAEHYGPTLVPGEWQVYKIPLEAFNSPTSQVAGTVILKFGVQDKSGKAGKFYVDDVGFE